MFGKLQALLLMLCVLGFGAVALSQPVGRMSLAEVAVAENVERLHPQPATIVSPVVETISAPVSLVNIDAAEAVWRDWMDRNDVVESSIAIGQGAQVLHSAAQRRQAQSAFPMASLSKAITGMCLNQVLNDTPYSWDSTLGDLQPEWSKINLTPAPEMADVTLNQLATHTSGLPKLIDYGETATRSVNLSSQSTMTRAALRVPSNFGTRDIYEYSNANYAILGTLIEAMTGETYAQYCGERILAPAGVTQAGVTGRMAQTAGYGGWSISVEDYAQFVMHWFDQSRPWMVGPRDFAFDENSSYGMGARMDYTRNGTHVGHYGRWTHNDPRWPNIGSMFFQRADGVVFVVSWDKSLDYDSYDDLRNSLFRAL